MNQRIRLASPASVVQMAAVNHAPVNRSSHFASVDLDGVRYFWSAA